MSTRLRVLRGHLAAGQKTPPTARKVQHGLLINGKVRAASNGKVVDVVNPATGQAFATVPEATTADLEEAISGSQEAFKTWSTTPFAERAAAMVAFGDALKANIDIFAEALCKEQGKPLGHAKREVMSCIQKCYHLAEIGDLKPELQFHEDKRETVEVHYTPRGVVAGITPWNFPMSMAANKLLPAVITGNTVVLKPSPYTPLTTAMMSDLAAKTFPAGVVNILTGGNELGAMMVKHPKIAHVSFTGSAATGKHIMASAAGTLKKLTLELGGNDAAIALPGSDVATVAPGVFRRAMYNSGQVCVAIKRLFVHEDQYEEMVAALAQQAEQSKVGDGMEQGVHFGPINNKMQYDRVNGLVKDAIKDGGVIAAGGSAVDNPAGGYFFKPTIIANVAEGSRIVDEEQFGPVLPVLKYSTVEEAIARSNNTDYGLGSSVWGSDQAEARAVGLKLEAGMTWINDHMSGGEQFPFGGIKSSGIGVEGGGQLGLKEFVDIKAIKVPKQRPQKK